MVLGILVVYTFLESTTTEEDFLTKLYNRQSYEVYLRHLMEIQRPFGIILIDLNYFKEINDQYGHQKGDEVLVAFAQALKRTFHNSALTARIGGDEFIVVVEKGKRRPEEYIDDIVRLLEKNEDPVIQSLSFSYGYQTFEAGMSAEELYTSADKKMYKYKRESKTV